MDAERAAHGTAVYWAQHVAVHQRPGNFTYKFERWLAGYKIKAQAVPAARVFFSIRWTRSGPPTGPPSTGLSMWQCINRLITYSSSVGLLIIGSRLKQCLPRVRSPAQHDRRGVGRPRNRRLLGSACGSASTGWNLHVQIPALAC